jgi:RimJ/RimL family protein N-acetyltransferase
MSHATKPAHPAAAGAPAARKSPLGWIPSWSRLAGHRPRPTAETGLVVLRDGSRTLIRPVRSADAPLVAEGFTRLSPRSRQMRFLTRKKRLSSAELRYFTDVDHHDHEALVALNPADGRGVGIARYIRRTGDPQAAEIAVTIVDEWQGRGLGTELVARLARRATSEGIHRFTALVAEDNTAVARMLRNTCASLAGRSPGTAEYEITLQRVGAHSDPSLCREMGECQDGRPQGAAVA